mmetsp:Transcript_78717/g.227591  ORF Transcript_78717/g.227591 Transcript_78717/m.227591 type:complete len:280 (+) Transcript_78717:176-1015(+)
MPWSATGRTNTEPVMGQMSSLGTVSSSTPSHHGISSDGLVGTTSSFLAPHHLSPRKRSAPKPKPVVATCPKKRFAARGTRRRPRSCASRSESASSSTTIGDSSTDAVKCSPIPPMPHTMPGKSPTAPSRKERIPCLVATTARPTHTPAMEPSKLNSTPRALRGCNTSVHAGLGSTHRKGGRPNKLAASSANFAYKPETNTANEGDVSTLGYSLLRSHRDNLGTQGCTLGTSKATMICEAAWYAVSRISNGTLRALGLLPHRTLSSKARLCRRASPNASL